MSSTYGCRFGSFGVLGTGVYGKLKFEIGVHRVQVSLI